ncbi:hypothetical protein GINT2_001046 [Glugoides intestinalis]
MPGRPGNSQTVDQIALDPSTSSNPRKLIEEKQLDAALFQKLFEEIKGILDRENLRGMSNTAVGTAGAKLEFTTSLPPENEAAEALFQPKGLVFTREFYKSGLNYFINILFEIYYLSVEMLSLF